MSKNLIAAVVLSVSIANAAATQEPDTVKMYAERADVLVLTSEGAAHFARLAIDCIHREYPNKLNQVLQSDEFLLSPTALHPAFYGCFDWHSSVHGHWMLVKLLKAFPEIGDREKIVAGLATSLTVENIAGEVAYFDNESGSWERTYGWAWLLQLAMELNTWSDPLGQKLGNNLEPLTQLIRDKYIEFLPRQEYPIRTGVHPNTAFGLSFALDYARSAGDEDLISSVTSAARRYYANDKDCPLSWEPSGEDFLSPCFEEAALMARVLSSAEYGDWLSEFLPGLSGRGPLSPANVSDRSDPKIVHLDGLNLSRAWNLQVIASRTVGAATAARLRAWAKDHLKASLPYVASVHYEGSHWLGSFAVYALTRSG
ncbi:MAG: DUF2891 domain-containing protein [Gammaproteobacteria bacterium]|nr:DUF2891 domain-containing protein [Gammaproteobacteria bacterium]MDH3552142.1 DUF2891 domain-containing protein [Gammaproteobacteria bacterium]